MSRWRAVERLVVEGIANTGATVLGFLLLAGFTVSPWLAGAILPVIARCLHQSDAYFEETYDRKHLEAGVYGTSVLKPHQHLGLAFLAGSFVGLMFRLR
jgi:hypothetical protein